MGNTNTKGTGFSELQDVINGLIDPKKKAFVNKAYMAELDSSKYTIVSEKQLTKNIRIELKDLGDAVYLIPLARHVTINDQPVLKENICKTITRHYQKIMQMLLLVKNVCDIENGGENSLAGIAARNIRVDNNIIEISYCIMDQHFKDSDTIDLKYLKGFAFYVNRFLTPQEREIFMINLQNFFARKSKTEMAKYMSCGDKLLSAEEYRSLVKRPGVKCEPARMKDFTDYVHRRVADKSGSFKVKVKKNNPLLHWRVCAEKRVMLIDLKVKTSQGVLKQYIKLKADYEKKIQELLKLVLLLVDKSSAAAGYQLKSLDTEQLNKIQTNIKKTIASFYLQSIANFHELMDIAKTVPHFTLNKDDVQNAVV